MDDSARFASVDSSVRSSPPRVPRITRHLALSLAAGAADEAQRMTEKSVQRPIWCRKCDYSLRGLDRSRCPECGAPFDIRDETTFSVVSPPGQCPECGNRPETVWRPLSKRKVTFFNFFNSKPQSFKCASCGATLERHYRSETYSVLFRVAMYALMMLNMLRPTSVHGFVTYVAIGTLLIIGLTSIVSNYEWASSGRYVKARKRRSTRSRDRRRTKSEHRG